MLMKNKKNIFLYLILIFFYLIQNLPADEFDISASNIKLFKDSEKIILKFDIPATFKTIISSD